MAESNAFTDGMENQIIDVFLRNAARTFGTAQQYIALIITNPVIEADTGSTITEPSAGGYGRQTVTFNASSGGLSANSAPVVWTASGGNYGTIIGIAICDAVTTGNVLMFDNSMTDVVINDGDTLTFPTGDIDVTVS